MRQHSSASWSKTARTSGGGARNRVRKVSRAADHILSTRYFGADRIRGEGSRAVGFSRPVFTSAGEHGWFRIRDGPRRGVRKCTSPRCSRAPRPPPPAAGSPGTTRPSGSAPPRERRRQIGAAPSASTPLTSFFEMTNSWAHRTAAEAHHRAAQADELAAATKSHSSTAVFRHVEERRGTAARPLHRSAGAGRSRARRRDRRCGHAVPVPALVEPPLRVPGQPG